MAPSSWVEIPEIATEAYSVDKIVDERVTIQGTNTLHARNPILGDGGVAQPSDIKVVDEETGAVWQVQSIGADNQMIRLVNTGNANQNFLLTYNYTPLDTNMIAKRRDEAIDYIKACLSGRVNYNSWTVVPPTIKTVARMIAASYILNTERVLDVQAPDEPRRKMMMARQLLMDWVKDQQGTTGTIRIEPIVVSQEPPTPRF